MDWKENEQSLKAMWDYNKGLSTHVIKVPEGEEKEGGRKSIF